MGQRMKKIHLISGSKFFDTILLVFKQGLSAKLAQRLVVHSNIESLYDHIPKEMLPRDLGGNEKSMKELHGKRMFLRKLLNKLINITGVG